METNKEKVTLRDTIIGLKLTVNYLLTKWLVIALCGILSAALGFFYAYSSKAKYKAVLTFAMEEKSGSLGNYANIASQFGIDIGGGGNGGAFVGDNLLELLKSRLLVQKTLLMPATVDGKNDLLVNHYIKLYEIDKIWESNSKIAPVVYEQFQLRKDFSLAQDSLLNGISNRILSNDLLVKKLDKKLNIVITEYVSVNQMFCKVFIEALVANASQLYIETKTKKSKQNVLLLQQRLDSVKNELDIRMHGAALSQDQNINAVRAIGKVPLAKDQLNIQLLSTMYGELIKNLELSKFTLMREEPIIQVIDSPILPLQKIKPGKFKSMILGGIIGGILIVSILLVSRIYKKLLTGEKGSDKLTSSNN